MDCSREGAAPHLGAATNPSRFPFFLMRGGGEGEGVCTQGHAPHMHEHDEEKGPKEARTRAPYVKSPPDIQPVQIDTVGTIWSGTIRSSILAAIGVARASAKACNPGDGDDLASGRRGCNDARWHIALDGELSGHRHWRPCRGHGRCWSGHTAGQGMQQDRAGPWGQGQWKLQQRTCEGRAAEVDHSIG